MSDAYLQTKSHDTVLVEHTKGTEQYNQGYRFVWNIQYGKTYVFKDKPSAPWGSGVYALNQDGTLGDCLIYNYDSSG